MMRLAWIGFAVMWGCEAPEPLPAPDENVDTTPDDTEPPVDDDTPKVVDDTAALCTEDQTRVAHLCIDDWTKPWTTLTSPMVNELDLPDEHVSVVAAVGERAFPARWDERFHTWMAASQHGSGRVVALGTSSLPFTGQDGLTVTNAALEWLDQSNTSRVTQLGGLTSWATPLAVSGWDVQPSDVGTLTVQDVAIIDAATPLSDSDSDALIAFVESGGGLLVAGQAVAPATPARPPDAMLLPLNQVLRELGLVITTMGVPDIRSPAPTEPPWLEQHAAGAMLALKRSAIDPLSVGIFSLTRARIAAESALRTLPATDATFHDVFVPLHEAYGDVIPTPEAPIDPEYDIAAHVLAVWEHRRHIDLDLPAPHPAAASFPRVPSTSGVLAGVVLNRDLTYDGIGQAMTFAGPSLPRIISTGVWAMPGEPILVELPPSIGDEGLGLQVGIHTNEIWDRGPWVRFPAITKKRPILGATTTISSAFGGPVYIRVPPGTSLGMTDITISGGVLMPTYDVSAATDWSAELAHPAPMGELVGDNVVITLPREQLEQLKSPANVLTFWDAILEAQSDLMGFPQRPRRDRIAADILADPLGNLGGYPIFPTGDAAIRLTNLPNLNTSGHWLMTTALGFNVVHEQLTLPMAPAIVPQLLSVYAYQSVVGGPIAGAHPNLLPAARNFYRMNYLLPSPNFAEYDDWVGLEAWLSIAESQGWPAIASVFSFYPPNVISTLNEPIEDRLDRMMVLTCTALAADACPYFSAWGWPVSNGACNICATRGAPLSLTP